MTELKGVGGWMILPIIGFCLTIFIGLLDISELLTLYYFSDVMELVILDCLIIAFPLITLIMIFKEKKEAKTWAIVSLIVTGGASLLIGDYFPVIGSTIWIAYFLNSKRVENTFVK